MIYYYYRSIVISWYYQNALIIVIPGDKDSSIMDKNDYDDKMQEMIDKGMQDGVYAKTGDQSLQD